MPLKIERMADLGVLSQDPRFWRHDNLLQTPLWGRLKQAFGWRPHHFLLDNTHPLLVLTRNLGGGFSLAYVPWGPGAPVKDGDWQILEEIARGIAARISEKLLFLRFDPPWEVDRRALGEKRRGRFHRASMDIQPPSTVLIDLTPSEPDILKGMKKKTRYNIHLSERKGVKVRRGTSEELSEWYKLYRITARRDGITLHSEEYYRTLFSLARGIPRGGPEIRLYLAEIDGKIEAGIVVSLQGRRATYLYGASSNSKRNYMPTYGLQWLSIREAKEGGCEIYDLYGIPPEEDPEHPMSGLYRFKVGFGGTVAHGPGSWDLPLKPKLYGIYRQAESLRSWYFRKLKKVLTPIGR